MTDPASITYDYTFFHAHQVPMAGANQVHTSTLQDFTGSGGTARYVNAYTYLDGWGRTRETQTVAPGGGATRVVTATRYDDSGMVAATTSPVSMTGNAGSGFANPTPAAVPSENRVSYDSLGRVTEDALYSLGVRQWGTTTSYLGYTTTVTPPVGMSSTSSLDAYGRVDQLTEHYATGQDWDTTYAYTPRGELTEIVDKVGNTTTYGYDWLGRRTSSDDPDTGHWTTSYDLNGNPVLVTDDDGAKTWTGYDELNRQTKLRATSSTGAVLAEWSYDATGQKGLLTASTDRTGTATDQVTVTNTSYDARDRVTARTWTVPAGNPLAGTYTIGYGYDPADRLVTTTYPAGGGLEAETITQKYGNQGYPTNLTGAMTGGTTPTYVASTSFYVSSPLAGRAYGGSNAVTRDYTYWPASQQLKASTTKVDGTAQHKQTTTYDPAGQPTQIFDNIAGQAECFSYDNARRLTTAFTRGTADQCGNGPNNANPAPYNHTYSYNPIGNLTGWTDTTSTTSTSYNYTYPAAMSAYDLMCRSAYGLTCRSVSGEFCRFWP